MISQEGFLGYNDAMSTAAIVFLSFVAFLSAPASFILLRILHRQTADRAVGELSFAVLAMAFTLLGILLTALAEGSARPLPYGVFVLLLDASTISLIMVGAFVCRFAHSATQMPVTPALRLTFWSWAFLLHALVLAAAVLPPATDVTNAFALSTLGSFLMQLYATVLIVAKRRRIPSSFFIPYLARYYPPLLLLGLLASASDILRFGQSLGGKGIPFSPFSSILVNGFIIAIISRKVVLARPMASLDSAATADFRLTLRESEILPLLLEGASNEEIGEKLHISPHTVKNHITDIFRKTGAESSFDLLKTFRRMESLNRGA